MNIWEPQEGAFTHWEVAKYTMIGAVGGFALFVVYVFNGLVLG